ncbi:MAG TPA: glutamate--cysteine ligase, partial [Thiotrichales bacterium]|nr:glutamate--cysteine ligase [Thiotrichales bacterium]
MGQEIDHSRFSEAEFATFGERLRAETARLGRWFEEGAFSRRDEVGGSELEVWLTDEEGRPAPVNERYLKHLD